jgi:dTMP kinase
MPGRFITLEGIEGVGKSTNLAFVADWLRGRQLSVVVTREPGGTPLAERLRQVLLESEGEVPPTAELLLMFAARASHLRDCVEPALARGDWVVCDRFTDASFAYQGGGRGLDAALIGTLEKAVQGDRFESENAAFFRRVRAAYLHRAQADPGRIKIIDAADPLPAVQGQLTKVLAEFVQRTI